MAEIRPFRGVRYNQSLVPDLSAVICPPYDVISPQMQQALYERSEHNFVRVEFSRELPQDTDTDNKHTRAAATLRTWIEKGILKVDDQPAIYVHDHGFTYQGKAYRRRNIIVSVRLEEWDKRVVRPHEGTLSRPKSDRLSMLWACQANASPILALYEDPGRRVAESLDAESREEPAIRIDRADGESHRVRAVTRRETVDEIRRSLAEQPLYIADGHHRYESALTYQRERLTYCPPGSRDAEFNFVMMALVDFDDPGLIILPPHRLVRGLSHSNLEGLGDRLKAFFDVEEMPVSDGVWDRVDHLLTGEASQDRLILFGLKPDTLLVLKLRDRAAVNGMMPYFHTDLYRQLMVSVVDHVVLERLLTLSSDRSEEVLAYSYDRRDAVKKVSDGEYQLALLISPVRPQVVKAIADAGDRMPRKSTYFYPKAPAGLVLRLL